MRPRRHFGAHSRRRDDSDLSATTFETFEGGVTVTGVKVFSHPIRLWIMSVDEGALATVTITPRRHGGFDVKLEADRTKSFDVQGLAFESAEIGVSARLDAPAPGFEAAQRALDVGALAVEEAAPAAEVAG